MSIIKSFKTALELHRKQTAEAKEKNEMAQIAKLFNDRYTYRVESVQGGYRWMCPECNRVYSSEKIAARTGRGLRFAACCSEYYGSRLHLDIRRE